MRTHNEEIPIFFFQIKKAMTIKVRISELDHLIDRMTLAPQHVDLQTQIQVMVRGKKDYGRMPQKSTKNLSIQEFMWVQRKKKGMEDQEIAGIREFWN